MRLPLLYASSNAGKIREVSSLLADEGIKLHVPADLGLALDVPETADTLEGNAELKARAWSELAPDHIVLADDTGLEIEALGGEPGVHVRRWRDRRTAMSDQEIIEYCLERMRGVPPGQRKARFRTVIALAHPFGLETVDGRLEGEIVSEPAGSLVPGLPFAALLYIHEWNMMLGEHHQLPAERKRHLSTHRARAVKAAVRRVHELVGL